MTEGCQRRAVARNDSPPPPLSSQMRGLLPGLLAFSAVSNLAVLISPLFMMQVLDRVVPSGNMQTLVLLLGLALAAIVASTVVDHARDRALDRLARWVERAGLAASLHGPRKKAQETVTNTAAMRVFLSGSQATMVLNVPWLPLFAVALFLINPLFLLILGGAAAVLIGAESVAARWGVGEKEALGLLVGRSGQVLRDALDRHVSGDVLSARNLTSRHETLRDSRDGIEDVVVGGDIALRSLRAGLRMVIQLGTLALGAALVARGSLSAGGMIGASLISAKAIGAVEGAVTGAAAFRGFLQATERLSGTMMAAQTSGTEVSELSGALRAEGLVYPRGGGMPPRLERISFSLAPGECLGIVGDSGCGKTTLLDCLSGRDPAPVGAVFLEESDVRGLSPESRAHLTGYLPQQATLYAGTLSENISSFAPNPDDRRVVAAARIAGVHGMISALPGGYDTDLGAAPYLLSAGQKQRVALARAIYHKPRYLFLDEPNALLDASGERQLFDTLSALKADGTTVIMVLHRSGIMGVADKVLFLDQGRIADFGPRAEVLGRISMGKRRVQLPVVSASLQDLNDWVAAQFTRSSDEAFRQKAILVATEMFNTLRENGPSEETRVVTLIFSFLDDYTCEIKMTEPRSAEMDEKIGKIQSLIRHPEVTMEDMEEDELAMAVILQLSEKFEVTNSERNSVYCAKLSSGLRENGEVVH